MTQTDEYFLENKPLFSGKIREVYNFSDDKILIKTSDKISAYDFVFEDELPNKGAILTKISKYWFKKTKHIIENHILNDVELKKLIPNTFESCTLAKKCKPIRIESIVRGYISGSAFKQYSENGKVNDIAIKDNMKINDKFESPIFTPSTKADVGDKDQNISLTEMYDLVGRDVSEFIKNKSFEFITMLMSMHYQKALHYLILNLSLVMTKMIM